MRKNVIILCCMVLIGLLTAPRPLFASRVSDDATPITIRKGNTLPGGAPRTPTVLPFSAYYDSVSESIVAVFLFDCGDSTVTIMNSSNGEVEAYSFRAVNSVYLPISGSAGLWQVTFTLASGEEYEGEFTI